MRQTTYPPDPCTTIHSSPLQSGGRKETGARACEDVRGGFGETLLARKVPRGSGLLQGGGGGVEDG